MAKCKQPVLGTADTGSHDDVILCGLLQQYMKMHIDAMDSRGGVWEILLIFCLKLPVTLWVSSMC